MDKLLTGEQAESPYEEGYDGYFDKQKPAMADILYLRCSDSWFEYINGWNDAQWDNENEAKEVLP